MKLKSGYIVPGERLHVVWSPKHKDGWANSVEIDLWEGDKHREHGVASANAIAQGLRDAGFDVRIVREHREIDEFVDRP